MKNLMKVLVVCLVIIVCLFTVACNKQSITIQKGEIPFNVELYIDDDAKEQFFSNPSFGEFLVWGIIDINYPVKDYNCQFVLELDDKKIDIGSEFLVSYDEENCGEAFIPLQKIDNGYVMFSQKSDLILKVRANDGSKYESLPIPLKDVPDPLNIKFVSK